MKKPRSLAYTLTEQEFIHDYDSQVESMETNSKINQVLDEIITEDTKSYYKEAPTKEEMSKLITQHKEEDLLKGGIDVWQQETKQEIVENISNRVIRKLNETKKENTVKEAQHLNIFSEFWILYLDYTTQEVKSTSTKIKEKDPILFGKIFSDSTKLYYIADWIDELCDFTLDQMVMQLNTLDPKFSIPQYKGISPKEVQELFTEVKRKEDLLKNTNSSNWREKQKEALNKPVFFKRLFGK